MADPIEDPLGELLEQTFKDCRRDGLSIHDAFQIVATAMRAEVLDKIGTKEYEGLVKADYVHVQSIVGAASGNPMVQGKVGLERWQWDVEQAREHAMAVLQCSEAAIHDAALLRFATLGELNMDRALAFRMIYDLRRFRGDVEREDWRPTT